MNAYKLFHPVLVRRLFFGLCLSLYFASSFAALNGTTALVSDLRIEGNAGLIGVSVDIPNCGGRVWVDMTTAVGRSVYATAMMAFTLKKTVTIRAYDDSQRIFGACTIYDIYVANN